MHCNCMDFFMNDKYKEYLQSAEWGVIRAELFILRGKKCERCKSTKKLNIHHLHYRNIFNEEPEDLEILCRECHEKEHGIVDKKKLRLFEKKRRAWKKRQSATTKKKKSNIRTKNGSTYRIKKL